MLDAVSAALARDRERRNSSTDRAEVLRRYASLTSREREVLALVTAGLINRRVAGELGLSVITVKLHRASMMRKMGLRRLADLVHAAEALKGICRS